MDEHGRPMGTPKSARGQNDLIWGPRLRCPRVWWIRCARPWGLFAPIARKTCIGPSRKSNGSAATAESATPHTIPKGRPDGNLVDVYHSLSLYDTLWWARGQGQHRSTRLLKEDLGRLQKSSFDFLLLNDSHWQWDDFSYYPLCACFAGCSCNEKGILVPLQTV